MQYAMSLRAARKSACAALMWQVRGELIDGSKRRAWHLGRRKWRSFAERERMGGEVKSMVRDEEMREFQYLPGAKRGRHDGGSMMEQRGASGGLMG